MALIASRSAFSFTGHRKPFHFLGLDRLELVVISRCFISDGGNVRLLQRELSQGNYYDAAYAIIGPVTPWRNGFGFGDWLLAALLCALSGFVGCISIDLWGRSPLRADGGSFFHYDQIGYLHGVFCCSGPHLGYTLHRRLDSFILRRFSRAKVIDDLFLAVSCPGAFVAA